MTRIAAKPTLSIRPVKGWYRLDLGLLWSYRELLWTFAARDIKLRYRQTFLGVAWVIFQPLIAAAVLSFVFNKVAGFSSGNLPYFHFAMAGLLGWNVFSGTLARSSGSVLAQSGLVSKAYFPRLILPLSTAISVLLDFAIALTLLLILMASRGILPPVQIVFLPLWLMLLLALALGIGMAASAMMVTYRDIGHILPVLTNLLLYATPVVYSLSDPKIADKFTNLQVFFQANPLSGLMEALRWSLLDQKAPNPGQLAYAAMACIFIFLGGAFLFQRMERRFADVI